MWVRSRAVQLGAMVLAALAAISVAAKPSLATPEPLPDTARPPLAHRELILQGLRHGFEGDYDAASAVWQQIRALDPGHPAAPVFETNTLYWFQMFDDEDRRWDQQITALCDEGIRLSKARLDADPDDLEGHFYMGQSLMNRGRLKGIRGRYYSAGTDGERARKHLERVLELRPDLVDGRYQVGLYYFYASLLPRLVSRFLGWLWFVPSGDGPTGLRYLNEVAAGGDLYRDDARFILGNIRTYHEPQYRRALALVGALHDRYPRNTLIHFELLEVRFEMRDYPGAIGEARRLEARSARNAFEESRIRMARVWRARAELLSGGPETAWQTLSVFDGEVPDRPLWGGAWINLTRGQVLDALGERERALAAYERVLAYEAPRGSQRASELARAAVDEPFRLDEPSTKRAADAP